jgi:hypothetical protein
VASVNWQAPGANTSHHPVKKRIVMCLEWVTSELERPHIKRREHLIFFKLEHHACLNLDIYSTIPLSGQSNLVT